MLDRADRDALVSAWLPFYREAHAFPELAHHEHRTTDRIEAKLDRLGIERFRPAETGTVAILRNGDGPTVAFRADIDGLPVLEATGLDYASKNHDTLDGDDVPTMHACGHDTHFASALAAADYLASHRDEWSGTVVFVFQPAEETGSGADAMLAGGLWDRAPKPSIVLGQHVTRLPGGVVSLKPEHLMSLADSLTVTVTGKQAHGSMPDESIDPIVAAAHMIVRLQTVVSRELPPRSGAVVTVSRIHGGSAPNIIPDSVTFTLNIRTPSDDLRTATLEAVNRIIENEAAASRARVAVTELNRFPRCYNDPENTERVIQTLAGTFGVENVTAPEYALTGSEDVGALADAIGVPMVYWMFGAFPSDAFAHGQQPPIPHSPFFGPDASLALETGVSAAVNVLLSYVGSAQK